MQFVGPSLRRTGASTLALTSSYVSPITRAVMGTPQRSISMGSPFDWLRNKMGPRLHEKPSKDELEAARKEQATSGQGSVFDSLAEAEKPPEETQTIRWVNDQELLPRNADLKHKYSTANFKISHRKLNKLGRQISGKPIDSAILQMMFSEKRASSRIKSMLVVAKKHALDKGLQEQRLVVSEAWVTKGPKQLKRMEPKGRGRYGIRIHPDSRLSVVLREGKTVAELKEEARRKTLKRVVSAGLIREDVPLRNPAPAWAW